MGGGRFGRASVSIGTGGCGRTVTGAATARALGCLATLMVTVLALAPASASAESLCTDTWAGPSEGTWQTAVDWSTSKVPASTDVACIGAGKTVKVEGASQTGVVQGEGNLVLSGGSLELANTLEVSSIASFSISNSTLSGSGTLSVSHSFSWGANGTMEGSGKTVVASGATGTLEAASGCEPQLDNERTFVNEGILTLNSEGEFVLGKGAHFENSGTFKANSQETCHQFQVNEGAAPLGLITNTGTFEKTTGTGTTKVAVPIENKKTVSVQAGNLDFDRGGSTPSASEWLASEGSSVQFTGGTLSLASSTWSGAIDLSGASVMAENVSGVGSQVDLSSGSLRVTSGNTATIGTFTLTHATVSGLGTLSVSHSLSWGAEGTMEGLGKTVVASGATGTLEAASGCQPQLDNERTFINEGTLTFSSEGEFILGKGAHFENSGTFKANSEETCHTYQLKRRNLTAWVGY